MRYAMIMAGGIGSRLWPMSRRTCPKHLLPLAGDVSLLQCAAERLEGIVNEDRRLVCTAEAHRSAVLDTLPGWTDERILGEPEGRDTLNAVGLTAAVLEASDPDACFAVLTADHLITPQDAFARCMETGFALVESVRNRFVTFSINPTHAATGYGYVKQGKAIEGFKGAYEAAAFREKPDAETATAYVASGEYGWNSGMFIFHAATFLDTMGSDYPDACAGLREIAAGWGTPEGRNALERIYPELDRVSVDTAIMEPAVTSETVQVCCVPMDVSWKDIGSWSSYGDTLPADADGNRARGQAVHLDSTDVLTVSDDPDHLIATIGCTDIVVVHTGDATLVCSADQAEKVKELVSRIDETHR